MMTKLSYQKIVNLSEGLDLEIKTAGGQDGRGKLPANFFETYSAMANSHGGVVLLGMKQISEKEFGVIGITEPQKVITELWNGLNNPQLANVNLLRDADVTLLTEFNPPVIKIKIPRASRQQCPVYTRGNPMGGTYRRNHEGDFPCPPEIVKRMLADQLEEGRDNKILTGLDFEAIDLGSFNRYRTVFSTLKPTHPFAGQEPRMFLESLGGWAKDRQTKEEGVTVGGLLMFGKLRNILNEFPTYLLDYRELPRREDSEQRWVDRLTTDFSWSGNLYDFYRLVSQKLFQGLKVPFRLEGTTRVDDTPVHEALREALVNCLIHADYTGRLSVLVVKRPDLFGFRNPGMMRIPSDMAIRGGISDCRNRTIQKIFQLIGEGEQAGSGLPKVYRNWTQQHWLAPSLWDTEKPDDQTLLELRMASLIRPEAVEKLRKKFGTKFERLSETERLALVTASEEGSINHTRLKEICWEHPHDISLILSGLVEKKFFDSDGFGRGTVYYVKGECPGQRQMDFLKSPEMLPPAAGGSQHLPIKSEHLGGDSEHLPSSSEHLEKGSEDWRELEKIAEPVSVTGRANQTNVRATILELCKKRTLTLQDLAALLNRSADSLRIHYLNRMVKDGELALLFPKKPNHPNQAYTAGQPRPAK